MLFTNSNSIIVYFLQINQIGVSLLVLFIFMSSYDLSVFQPLHYFHIIQMPINCQMFQQFQCFFLQFHTINKSYRSAIHYLTIFQQIFYECQKDNCLYRIFEAVYYYLLHYYAQFMRTNYLFDETIFKYLVTNRMILYLKFTSILLGQNQEHVQNKYLFLFDCFNLQGYLTIFHSDSQLSIQQLIFKLVRFQCCFIVSVLINSFQYSFDSINSYFSSIQQSHFLEHPYNFLNQLYKYFADQFIIDKILFDSLNCIQFINNLTFNEQTFAQRCAVIIMISTSFVMAIGQSIQKIGCNEFQEEVLQEIIQIFSLNTFQMVILLQLGLVHCYHSNKKQIVGQYINYYFWCYYYILILIEQASSEQLTIIINSSYYKTIIQIFKQMKKIVFVEKEDNSTYDPVSTFLANRKANSAVKPSANKIPVKPVESKITQKKIPSTKKQQPPLQMNIGRKGEHIIKSNSKIMPKKQQTIYEHRQRQQQYQKQSYQQQSKANQIQVKQQSNQRVLDVKPELGNKQKNVEISTLKKKIAQLQSMIEQYNRKQQQWDQKQQKLFKTEQKLQKIQKQHKQNSSQAKNAVQKLKQKQQEIKKILAKGDVKYSKIRQITMMNQINKLKKQNRELVTRIKNYKGTDLVQLAISKNKTQILDQYDIPTDLAQQQDLSELQSLCFRLCQHLNQYLSTKCSSKSYPWTLQQKNISQGISSQCIKREFKIPKCNEDALSVYNQIEVYRSKLSPLIDHHDLSFTIAEDNITLINNMQKIIIQQAQLRSLPFNKLVSLAQNSPKKFKKVSEAIAFCNERFSQHMLQIQKRTNYLISMIAHCLCQQVFLKQWVDKNLGNITNETKKISKKMQQIQQIMSVGDAGIKETLYLFMEANLSQITFCIPKIFEKTKQFSAYFKNMGSVDKK